MSKLHWLKKHHGLAVLILVGSGFWFISCGKTSSSSSSILPDLLQADSIEFTDAWNGLAPAAPFKSHYSLQRNNEGFKGKADFSVGGQFNKQQRTAVEDVEIPPAAARSFLETLAKSTLKEGKYEPKIEHTDDYPSITVEVKVKAETVTFFSRSQGVDNVPWGVEFKGKTYVVASNAPAKALEMLDPYLKRDTLDRLVKEIK